MTSTPKSCGDESLNDSWFEVNTAETKSQTTDSPVHMFEADHKSSRNIERLLREARKESQQSSPAYSGINSHSISPTSPMSPVFCGETPITEAIFMNKDDLSDSGRVATDWMWHWSINPDVVENKSWSCHEPLKKPRLNLRQWAVRRGIFSKEVLSLLLLSNILSLILGAGIGYTILLRKSM